LTKLKDEVVELIRTRGLERREVPFRLSSGQESYDYIDGKRAISNGPALRTAAEAVIELAQDEGVEFDAIGGLTMGADPLAHAVSIISGKAWFSVRKAAKQHGKQKLIEGFVIDAGTAVLVVDDVVTTGASIEQAIDALESVHADIVFATTLLDRGDTALKRLKRRGVRYRPLLTYEDLGIAPVFGETGES